MTHSPSTAAVYIPSGSCETHAERQIETRCYGAHPDLTAMAARYLAGEMTKTDFKAQFWAQAAKERI